MRFFCFLFVFVLTFLSRLAPDNRAVKIKKKKKKIIEQEKSQKNGRQRMNVFC